MLMKAADCLEANSATLIARIVANTDLQTKLIGKNERAGNPDGHQCKHRFLMTGSLCDHWQAVIPLLYRIDPWVCVQIGSLHEKGVSPI